MNRTDLLSHLSARILAVNLPHPVRVALDGVDAAGKTTLADELAGAIRAATRRLVIRATIDRFHNPREVRYRQGPDSPEGYFEDSFDLDAFKARLLDPLGPGGSRVIQAGLFDFRTNAPAETAFVTAPPDAILLCDGVFLLRPELAGCWDYSIFVQVDFATVLARAAQRDQGLLGSAAQVIDRYTKRYIPAQRRYLETCRPLEQASIVIRNDDPDSPEILTAR